MKWQYKALLTTPVVIGIGCSAAGYYGIKKVAKLLSKPGLGLHGKTVLITGGSRGLGLALAEEFARAGCHIAICARDADEVERARHKLAAICRAVEGFTADVTDKADIADLIQAVIRRFGRIDILVNNAGEIKVAPLDSLERGDFESSMDTMFWGPVDMTLEALPHMRRQGSGHIVNISSIGGRVSVPRLLPYCCAKFALVAFSEGMGAELNADGIRVLTVSPGLMRTGSYLKAQFKGAAEDEFTWFGLAANLPGFSVAAAYAAKEIRKSIEKGHYTCTISFPAKMLLRIQGMLPETTRRIMATVNQYLLPESKNSHVAFEGGALNSRFGKLFQTFTALGRKAAHELNETA